MKRISVIMADNFLDNPRTRHKPVVKIYESHRLIKYARLELGFIAKFSENKLNGLTYSGDGFTTSNKKT